MLVISSFQTHLLLHLNSRLRRSVSDHVCRARRHLHFCCLSRYALDDSRDSDLHRCDRFKLAPKPCVPCCRRGPVAAALPPRFCDGITARFAPPLAPHPYAFKLFGSARNDFGNGSTVCSAFASISLETETLAFSLSPALSLSRPLALSLSLSLTTSPHNTCFQQERDATRNGGARLFPRLQV